MKKEEAFQKLISEGIQNLENVVFDGSHSIEDFKRQVGWLERARLFARMKLMMPLIDQNVFDFALFFLAAT